MQTVTDLLVPRSTDVELGQQIVGEIEGELTLHADPVAQAWVAELGARLVAAAPGVPSEFRFRFQLVDEPGTVNAFALPGGPIYVYSGLVLAAQSEAEVAGVVGHEIAHVVHRHGAQQLIAQLGADAVLAIALGDDPGALAQLGAQIGASGALLAYGRDHETDADELGVRIVMAGGYDPLPMIEFFDRLDARPSPPASLSSHPDPGNRARRLRSIVAREASPPTFRGDADAFAALQARLR